MEPDLNIDFNNDDLNMESQPHLGLDFQHTENFDFQYSLFDSEADEALPNQGELDAWLFGNDGTPSFIPEDINHSLHDSNDDSDGSQDFITEEKG